MSSGFLSALENYYAGGSAQHGEVLRVLGVEVRARPGIVGPGLKRLGSFFKVKSTQASKYSIARAPSFRWGGPEGASLPGVGLPCMATTAFWSHAVMEKGTSEVLETFSLFLAEG